MDIKLNVIIITCNYSVHSASVATILFSFLNVICYFASFKFIYFICSSNSQHWVVLTNSIFINMFVFC